MAEEVRLDIYPDGGMARLRVLGRPTAAARAGLAERFLRLLPESQLADLLRAAGLAAAEAVRIGERVRTGEGVRTGEAGWPGEAGRRGGGVAADLPASLREQLRLGS